MHIGVNQIINTKFIVRTRIVFVLFRVRVATPPLPLRRF
eukprot:COSAG02_NODE_38237_length_431_cov_1.216867_2_plen_38_part_01